jgi:hypothetical protein
LYCTKADTDAGFFVKTVQYDGQFGMQSRYRDVGAVKIGSWEKNGKFVPSQSPYDIDSAQTLLHALRNLSKGIVACLVSPVIVDAFEIIEIKEADDKRLVVPPCARQLGMYC